MLGEVLQYPHNIFLELSVECGLACAFYFALSISALLWFLWVQGTHPRNTYARILLQLVLFYVINASVSGDINDNRYLLAVLCLGMTYSPSIDEGGNGLFWSFGKRRTAEPVLR